MNVYLPSSQALLLQDLEDIKNQLSKSFIILGDFNAHNSLWGFKNTD